MRRKGVALLVAALMVWTLAMPALAQVNPFTDLRSDHWAYEAVVMLAAAGLVEGYPDGTFGGDRTFTRYEMAMVFARILARFERLIDAKIAEGIEVKTGDLTELIRRTRQELAAKIQANHDELSADLRRIDERLGALEATAAAGSPDAGLTPAAEAALSELAIEELASRIREMATKSDVQDLASRIAAAESRIDGVDARVDDLAAALAALEGDMLTEADARAIAELAIADALAERDREVRAALSAAQGDTEGLAELVQSRVAALSEQIDRLANEFRPELERLGVKVAELDERIKRQEAATASLSEKVAQNTSAIGGLSEQVSENTSGIAELRALTDNVRLSGKSETTFVQTAVEGPVGDAYKDPRDHDSGKWSQENSFESKLTLGLAAAPAENVEINAELVLNDLFGGPDGIRPGLNLDVTTPGVLRLLHVGDLDSEHIAESFDKYTLVAGSVNDVYKTANADFQGANVDLVFGYQDSTTLSGFASRKADADHVFGAAASYTLSDEFAFTFRGVKDVTTPASSPAPPAAHSDAAIGVTVGGALDAVDYSVTYVANADEDPATAIDAWAKTPVAFATAEMWYASVGQDFNPTFGKALDSKSDDWLDRKLTPPDDWVENGESDMAATFSAPLLGVDTAVTVGRRTDPAVASDNNTYTQVEVGPVHFAGLDTSLLYDRRTNAANAVDNTLRATFETSIAGAAIAATVHNRSNAQVAAPEDDQRSTWVTASKEVNLLLPLTVDARYALNQALSETSTKLGVSTEREVGPVLLKAGYSTEQNALGDVDEDVSKTWWKNAEWAGSDKRDIATVGAEYTLQGFFGTDIDTGYEYRLVRVNDATLGTARNTFSASFEKDLRGGEATLSGEGKYVTGGIPSEAGNESDLTAKLTLTYPVFEGADLKVGGAYVSSSGAKAAVYSVFNLNAGLTVEF